MNKGAFPEGDPILESHARFADSDRISDLCRSCVEERARSYPNFDSVVC